MVIRLFKTDKEIIYPDSDGKPIADNTIQFHWITFIQYNLDLFFVSIQPSAKSYQL